MYAVYITTAVAKFTFNPKGMSLANAHAWAGRRAANHPEEYICIYNNAGDCTFEAGDKSIVPAIWTHVPVPLGMGIAAVQENFEDRATHVLGDYHNGTPQLLKCVPDGPWIYKDNRYYCEGVRMAWMMYVDLAVQFHNKGVV